MGYLNELRDDVTKRLEALDTQSRDDVQAFLNFIANVVLESYRNGQKSCAKKRAAGEKRQSGARAKRRA
jgi:hypothetical protein